MNPYETLKTARKTRDQLPVIRISPDEQSMCDEAVKALTGCPDLYQRGGSLVDVTREIGVAPLEGSVSTVASIRRVPVPRLRELLSSSARFERLDKRTGEWVPVHVPHGIVLATESRGHWPGIRNLVGITQYPILRPDGSVLSAPGYDQRTGLLYEPNGTFPVIPDKPTQKEAIESSLRIMNIVRDFPFATDAHRAAWLTIPLTLVGRHAFEGCTPMVLIDANTPGAGKTTLAETGVAVISGRALPRMVQTASDEENRKRITSIALAGESVALIDNVVGKLGGPSFDTVLTSTEWSDRLLGENRQIRVPIATLWLVTGNNASLSGDLLRRTLHIRLETSLERPEERSGWTYKLPEAAIGLRPKMVIDALTILRAYHLAGRPLHEYKDWGSFDSWGKLVRGAVVWVGMPDPVETRKELTESADGVSGGMRALLDALEAHALAPKCISAAELCARASEDPHLLAALEELIYVKVTARTVGCLFRRMRNRVFGDRTLERVQSHTRVGVLWTVRVVSAATTTPTGGHAKPSTAAENDSAEEWDRT